MFEYIEGRIVSKNPAFVVMDVNGIGYKIEIPLSTYENLPSSGKARLYTSLKISEEEMHIYGFSTPQERQIFEILTRAVHRIGPAKALTILSNTNIDKLLSAIAHEDTKYLRSIKGIGDKLANRLVVELKGAIPSEALPEELKKYSLITRDAIQALITLGYNKQEAEEAVISAQRTLRKDVKVEDLIRFCLDRLK
jgi:Holliday junction DNA helicase RuvA